MDTQMTDIRIMAEVAKWQEIQMRNSPSTKIWQAASVELHKLFAIMAKRHPSDLPVTDAYGAMNFLDRVIKCLQNQPTSRDLRESIVTLEVVKQLVEDAI
jgi:hypothetical protein